MRWSLWTFIGAAACGPSLVPDHSSELCLHWDEDPETGSDPPAGDTCEIAEAVRDRFAQLDRTPSVVPEGVMGLPVSSYTVEYACIAVETDSECPPLAQVEFELDDCLASRTGAGCEANDGGLCKIDYVWSVCGPDPNAVGACCYHSYVASFEFWNDHAR